MIKFKSTLLTIISIAFIFSCEQQEIDYLAIDQSVSAPSGEAGEADFTKFVAIGGAYTAGFGDGGLLHDGLQPYSVGASLASRIALSGGDTGFSQPDINSENGFFGPGADGVVGTADDEGRWYLTQSASTGDIGISRAPGDAASLSTPYEGDMSAIQNFAVGKQTMGQFLIPNDGSAAPVNPWYSRFDASGGTVSALAQMIGSGGTFFMAWFGAYDFLAHYARGGDGNVFPEPTATAIGPQFEQALQSMITSDTTWKGVVATVPDVLASPFFQILGSPTGLIPMDATEDAATLGQLAQLSGAYNQTVDGFAFQGVIGSTEAASRKLSWSAGNNSLLINDEALTDLEPYWRGMLGTGQLDSSQYQMLLPYRMARQAKEGEIVHFLARPILGEPLVAGDPTQGVWGVSAPLTDVYFLTGAELQYLETQRLTYNGMIKQAVATHGDGRVAVADFDGWFENLATGSPNTIMGSAVTYDFNPPTGMWSVDGLLPNARGYSLMADHFAQAINDTFGSSLPMLNPADVPGVRLPVTIE
ncbi:MAG: hypothetical protein CBE50_001010 [Flammeovirgaceae bacterium TMED290]|nr:MAG: hypothetical protein CBE50_001010 [Flammeovirgaceae bacterium TMED290]